MAAIHATNSSIRLKRIVPVMVFLVSIGSAASAQTPPEAKPSLETILAPDKTVWITDSAGREEKTRIVGVSGETVTADAGDGIRRFRTQDIVRVTARHSDPVLNGALIGAGAAVVSGLFLCRLTEPWRNCRDDVGPMLRMGALGAGVGIGIDALIRGRRTIYEAPQGSARLRAAPILAPHGGGLQLSFSF
jgi:hypothetical protein